MKKKKNLFLSVGFGENDVKYFNIFVFQVCMVFESQCWKVFLQPSAASLSLMVWKWPNIMEEGGTNISITDLSYYRQISLFAFVYYKYVCNGILWGNYYELSSVTDSYETCLWLYLISYAVTCPSEISKSNPSR